MAHNEITTADHELVYERWHNNGSVTVDDNMISPFPGLCPLLNGAITMKMQSCTVERLVTGSLELRLNEIREVKYSRGGKGYNGRGTMCSIGVRVCEGQWQALHGR